MTILDISQAALDHARARVGRGAVHLTWLNMDITRADLPRNFYDHWHDRAMFHFLTDTASRNTYIRRCKASVKAGGTIIIATFASDGPDQCGGLPTTRYSPEEIQRQLGPYFQLIETEPEMHVTPWGKHQSFVYCMLQMYASKGN